MSFFLAKHNNEIIIKVAFHTPNLEIILKQNV
jgi:hypothetical protein